MNRLVCKFGATLLAILTTLGFGGLCAGVVAVLVYVVNWLDKNAKNETNIALILIISVVIIGALIVLGKEVIYPLYKFYENKCQVYWSKKNG